MGTASQIFGDVTETETVWMGLMRWTVLLVGQLNGQQQQHLNQLSAHLILLCDFCPSSAVSTRSVSLHGLCGLRGRISTL